MSGSDFDIEDAFDQVHAEQRRQAEEAAQRRAEELERRAAEDAQKAERQAEEERRRQEEIRAAKEAEGARIAAMNPVRRWTATHKWQLWGAVGLVAALAVGIVAVVLVQQLREREREALIASCDVTRWIEVPSDSRATTAVLWARCADSVGRTAMAQWMDFADVAPLEILAQDGDPRVRAAAAANPYLYDRLLWQLADDKDPAVRASVANNPMVSEELLAQLVADPKSDVQLAVLRKGRLTLQASSQALVRLSQHPDEAVRLEVATFQDLPGKALEALAGDPVTCSVLADGGHRLSPDDAGLRLDEPAPWIPRYVQALAKCDGASLSAWAEAWLVAYQEKFDGAAITLAEASEGGDRTRQRGSMWTVHWSSPSGKIRCGYSPTADSGVGVVACVTDNQRFAQLVLTSNPYPQFRSATAADLEALTVADPEVVEYDTWIDGTDWQCWQSPASGPRAIGMTCGPASGGYGFSIFSGGASPRLFDPR